jgi:hypothetical protein
MPSGTPENPQKGDIVVYRDGFRAKVVNLNSGLNYGPDVLYDLRILEGIPRRVICSRRDFAFPAPEPIEKIESAARHEAGHIVIAAVQGLKLRPEGLMVDSGGRGLARYCTQPDESDPSREAVILATFAGFLAEKRFCEEHAHPFPEAMGILLSPDWVEARKLIRKLSDQYFSNENMTLVQSRLENRSKLLVEHHWRAIEGLATALLIKRPEPVKPLDSGDEWSNENSARCLRGEEAVALLSQYGIDATCEPGRTQSSSERIV